MDEIDTTTQRITRSYPTSLGDIRDDLKKQILLNHTGSRLSYNQIPLVHGRSVGARLDASSGKGADGCGSGTATTAGGTNNPLTKGKTAGGRTRMANHQRNLSLDFRSMGIVLPPVSQVTNTRVNLTQHHRNRSLDSALQGIPEVEVSSPSAELEKTICTNSLYGATMCSKISTSLYNSNKPYQKNLIESTGGGCGDDDDCGHAAGEAVESTEGGAESTAVAAAESTAASTMNNKKNNEFGDWRSDNGDMETMSRPGDCMMTTNLLLTKNSDSIVVPNKMMTSTLSSSSSHLLKKKSAADSAAAAKKRDDLTCLGSDDSGIICNSEHEHAAVSNKVPVSVARGMRNSRDSISSQGDDMIEETEDEMFSQHEGEEEEGDEHVILSRTPSEEAEDENNEDDVDSSQHGQQFMNSYGNCPQRIVPLVSNSNNKELHSPEMMSAGPSISSPSPDGPFPVIIGQQQQRDARLTMANGIRALSIGSGGVTNKSEQCEVTSPTTATTTATVTKDHKNDVMFKSFFGATKNAIFRTAQSIIENHEKKSSSKKLSIELQPGEFVEDGASPSPGTAAGTPIGGAVQSPTQMATQQSQSLSTNTPATSPVVLSPTTENATILAPPKKREFFTLKPKIPVFHLPGGSRSQQAATVAVTNDGKSEGKKLPGTVHQYVIREQKEEEGVGTTSNATGGLATGKGNNASTIPSTVAITRPSKADHNGLLRFFESPIFNIHFAVHYLFYSKEPGVLMFIANKIFSFPDDEVDLYIPQLILMYTQMDELAEILDSYLVYRCRKSVDFSLKCAWLLEAYNLNVLESVKHQGGGGGVANKVSRLYLLKELYPKRERKMNSGSQQSHVDQMLQSPVKKTHHRSQSDATGLFGGVGGSSVGNKAAAVVVVNGEVVTGASTKGRMHCLTVNYPKPLALGDLTTGRAFDNGCLCFVTVRGTVNDLRGQKTVCSCGAPKLLPEREFMKILIEIGRTLTSLPTKSEKTTALRMFLNLINKNLPARVWLPLHSEIPHHVVRITEDKTAVLNSKDKTPYIIYVEVVEVNDIYTSPVMPKLMPTLRHTKSEEHLEIALGEGQKQSGVEKEKKVDGAKVAAQNVSNQLRPEDANGEEHEKLSNRSSSEHCFDLRVREDDVWSQEDDEITAQYIQMQKFVDRDAVSQLSMDSCDSKDQGAPVLFNIRDVRNRHCVNLNVENTRTFSNDPEDPSAAALKEPWDDKEKQIRMSSPYGHLPNWKLLSVIVKSGDDLRQELMATQLLQMFRLIWEEESVGLWVRPYKIVCLSNDSGLIEPILNTVSIHQIKKNSNKSLKEYFVDEYGDVNGDRFQEAQRKFMQSCAAYCLISYLLQVKDRHNGNILLHADGHLIHIDFGFILNISPKNLGFEQSPFKLTPEFVDVMGGPTSELWGEFKHLLLKGLLAARKHMERIINIVEIMRSSSQLPCFKNGCSTTVRNLRNRFHMGLTEQELERKVEQLIQDSLNSLSTKLYDGYQYYTNGIL